MKLDKIIKKKEFDLVNEKITEENFPKEEIRAKCQDDYKLFHFNGDVSSDYAIEEIEEEGYSPANLYELLDYDWNGEDIVIALGSVAKVVLNRRVIGMWRRIGGRKLDLYWFSDSWFDNCRFLGVRNSQNLELSPLEPLTLEIQEITVNGVTYVRKSV